MDTLYSWFHHFDLRRRRCVELVVFNFLFKKIRTISLLLRHVEQSLQRLSFSPHDNQPRPNLGKFEISHQKMVGKNPAVDRSVDLK